MKHKFNFLECHTNWRKHDIVLISKKFNKEFMSEKRRKERENNPLAELYVKLNRQNDNFSIYSYTHIFEQQFQLEYYKTCGKQEHIRPV